MIIEWVIEQLGRHPLLRLFISVAGILGVCGCTTVSDAVNSKTDEALKLIENCPSWYQTPNPERLFVQEVWPMMKQLDGVESNVIRKAIEKYVEKHRAQRKYGIEEWCKLYLLNRCVCNVPEWAPSSEARSFGGWVGAPKKHGLVNLLWPLRLFRNGDLELVESNIGYMGQSYSALEEYDWFIKRYGRRSLNHK